MLRPNKQQSVDIQNIRRITKLYLFIIILLLQTAQKAIYRRTNEDISRIKNSPKTISAILSWLLQKWVHSFYWTSAWRLQPVLHTFRVIVLFRVLLALPVVFLWNSITILSWIAVWSSKFGFLSSQKFGYYGIIRRWTFDPLSWLFPFI